jgi:aminomuconate-semialdehyde/2-hydroxymuconate-6-semialdehyde dehydrogenase
MATLIVGDPLDKNTDIGAINSRAQLDKINQYLDIGKNEGAEMWCASCDVPTSGFFCRPTLFMNCSQSHRIVQEEIFGPVVTIMPFDTEEEVLEFANSTTYGLSATLWTENLNRAHRISARLKSGIIWVNCWLFRDLRTPFGGMKQSGVGREGGWEALRFFMETKNICIKL